MNIEATADLIMSARHSDAFDQEACVKILEDAAMSDIDAYGRGVTAGKLEALRYTPEERERYGKWAAINWPASRAAQPKPGSWQEIAMEAAKKINFWQQDGELGVPSLSKIILAAIDLSHATNDKQDWTTEKVTKPWRVNAKYAREICHAHNAAQPQSSKASPATNDKHVWGEDEHCERCGLHLTEVESRKVCKASPLGERSEQDKKEIAESGAWNCTVKELSGEIAKYVHQPTDQPPSLAKAADGKDADWHMLWNDFNEETERRIKEFGLLLEARSLEATTNVEVMELHEQLASERQRREQDITRLVKLKDDLVVDCRNNKQEADHYYQRLLSALAAIEKHNRTSLRPIYDTGLSALGKHDTELASEARQKGYEAGATDQYAACAELRKPLVALLLKCRREIRTPMSKRTTKVIDEIDALARVKEGE